MCIPIELVVFARVGEIKVCQRYSVGNDHLFQYNIYIYICTYMYTFICIYACSMLQCLAVCCIILHFVAVCCSVLQCHSFDLVCCFTLSKLKVWKIQSFIMPDRLGLGAPSVAWFFTTRGKADTDQKTGLQSLGIFSEFFLLPCCQPLQFHPPFC